MKKMIYHLAILISIALLMPFSSLAQNDIKKDHSEMVKLFPNPVSVNQELNIEILTDDNHEMTCFIYDFAGRLVKEEKLINTEIDDKTTLKVSFTEEGLYFIRLVIRDINTGQKSSIVKKFYIK